VNKLLGYLQLIWLMQSPPALFSRLFDLPWYRGMLEQCVAPLRMPQAKVLEVGCAAGDLSRLLAEQGMHVWGVDQSPGMLAKAQRVQSRAQFRLADAAHLPFPDQSFNIVFAASLINVVNSPRVVLTEMARVCRKGGTVSVLIPAQSFTSADAKRYVETERLSGFSGAAFTAWHHLARKMDVEVLCDIFTECGMENILTEELLGGMAVVISGRPGGMN
jgi:ubiquinone/menaquinone biosynthesis C-methylase UbiE